MRNNSLTSLSGEKVVATRYEISRVFIKGQAIFIFTFFVVRLQFLAVTTPGSLEGRLSKKKNFTFKGWTGLR